MTWRKIDDPHTHTHICMRAMHFLCVLNELCKWWRIRTMQFRVIPGFEHPFLKTAKYHLKISYCKILHVGIIDSSNFIFSMCMQLLLINWSMVSLREAVFDMGKDGLHCFKGKNAWIWYNSLRMPFKWLLCADWHYSQLKLSFHEQVFVFPAKREEKSHCNELLKSSLLQMSRMPTCCNLKFLMWISLFR